MAEITEVKRAFKYNSMVLQDPDVNMKPEEVRSFYSSVYPELTQAAVEGPENNENGELVYTFRKAIGTKGCLVVRKPRLDPDNILMVSEFRIHENARDPGLFYYDIRHGDDWGDPVTVEKTVFVNFFGTVVTAAPLELNDRQEGESMPDYLDLTPEEKDTLIEIMTKR